MRISISSSVFGPCIRIPHKYPTAFFLLISNTTPLHLPTYPYIHIHTYMQTSKASAQRAQSGRRSRDAFVVVGRRRSPRTVISANNDFCPRNFFAPANLTWNALLMNPVTSWAEYRVCFFIPERDEMTAMPQFGRSSETQLDLEEWSFVLRTVQRSPCDLYSLSGGHSAFSIVIKL